MRFVAVYQCMLEVHRPLLIMQGGQMVPGPLSTPVLAPKEKMDYAVILHNFNDRALIDRFFEEGELIYPKKDKFIKELIPALDKAASREVLRRAREEEEFSKLGQEGAAGAGADEDIDFPSPSTSPVYDVPGRGLRFGWKTEPPTPQ
jgi:hypothetical protein